MPHELFLLGVGVVFNWPSDSSACARSSSQQTQAKPSAGILRPELQCLPIASLFIVVQSSSGRHPSCEISHPGWALRSEKLNLLNGERRKLTKTPSMRQRLYKREDGNNFSRGFKRFGHFPGFSGGGVGISGQFFSAIFWAIGAIHF